MLDRLPVELLAYVLSFLVPPSSHRLTRPASLYACCLVSKRVKEVAQPLLWRAVVVDRVGEFQAVKREVGKGELGQHIRILEASGHEIKARALRTLVQSLPRLAEVRLRNFEADLSNAVDELLPQLAHLRRIGLSSVDFPKNTTPFPFNNLSTLSLYDMFVTKFFLAGLLQPQNLPVLHSLHLESLSAGQGQGTFLPSISDTLFSQLDILQLSLRDLHLATLEVIQHPTTLFSGTIYNLRQYVLEGLPPAPIKNLHIRSPDGLQAELLHSAIGTLQYMREYTSDVLGKLKAILPSSGIATLLLPIPLQHPALTLDRDELLAVCRTNGIEVLWEDEAGAGEEDGFSQEFRRWVVKKKRDEAERAS